jgi:4'-phosphopantetheinyl transferase
MNTERERWAPPPRRLSLAPDQVHVWRASLDDLGSRAARLAAVLSEDEARRAARFLVEQARLRFVVGRAVLRDILSRYLHVTPTALRFEYGAEGKPALAEPYCSLHFNVSHSGPLALYAVTRGRLVGVDLEETRPIPDAEQVAERFFSPAERAALRAMPEGQRRHAFYACWTRKEALVKALGGGLSIPLDAFDVSVEPEGPARLLGYRVTPPGMSAWSLQTLAPGHGFAAAICVEGRDWQLTRWQWPSPGCLLVC